MVSQKYWQHLKSYSVFVKFQVVRDV